MAMCAQWGIERPRIHAHALGHADRLSFIFHGKRKNSSASAIAFSSRGNTVDRGAGPLGRAFDRWLVR
jgi:hypothetical protein